MHVAELLSNYTKKLGIAQQQERAEEIAGYVSYPYMKKRWEKYCRAAKYESCDWNKVCGTINAFLMPIWGSVCKKEVFFGDWMPDIGRFLE
jgi:hypothetical protein